jgi:hypothetical protein
MILVGAPQVKSTLVTWRESIARLEALRQLRASIAALHDYPAASRDEMLSSLSKAIAEEEVAAADLQLKLNLEISLSGDGEETPSDF